MLDLKCQHCRETHLIVSILLKLVQMIRASAGGLMPLSTQDIVGQTFVFGIDRCSVYTG